MKNVFLGTANLLGSQLALPDEDREVVAYGLELVFSSLINLAVALAAGLLLGITGEIIAVILVWLLIRQLAGGAHCSTMWRCMFTSNMIIITLAMAAFTLSGILELNTLVCIIFACSALILWTTWIWAPADNPNKPIRSKARRKRFRRLAITMETVFIFVLLFVVLSSGITHASLALAAALSMGMLGFFITPVGYRAMAYIDKLLGELAKTVWRTKKGGEKI
jgi:accessory gene regulator B